MYHCNLQISVFSYQSVIGEVIRKIPQLEYVSHCVIKRAIPDQRMLEESLVVV